MAARAATLADRRLVLLARSQRLRAELGGESAALATRFQLADRLVGIARSGLVRTLLVGGGALLLFGRPRQLFRTAGKLLVLWPILKPFLPGLIRWWRGDERL
jgi:hypothetical protein